MAITTRRLVAVLFVLSTMVSFVVSIRSNNIDDFNPLEENMFAEPLPTSDEDAFGEGIDQRIDLIRERLSQLGAGPKPGVLDSLVSNLDRYNGMQPTTQGADGSLPLPFDFNAATTELDTRAAQLLDAYRAQSRNTETKRVVGTSPNGYVVHQRQTIQVENQPGCKTIVNKLQVVDLRIEQDNKHHTVQQKTVCDDAVNDDSAASLDKAVSTLLATQGMSAGEEMERLEKQRLAVARKVVSNLYQKKEKKNYATKSRFREAKPAQAAAAAAAQKENPKLKAAEAQRDVAVQQMVAATATISRLLGRIKSLEQASDAPHTKNADVDVVAANKQINDIKQAMKDLTTKAQVWKQQKQKLQSGVRKAINKMNALVGALKSSKKSKHQVELEKASIKKQRDSALHQLSAANRQIGNLMHLLEQAKGHFQARQASRGTAVHKIIQLAQNKVAQSHQALKVAQQNRDAVGAANALDEINNTADIVEQLIAAVHARRALEAHHQSLSFLEIEEGPPASATPVGPSQTYVTPVIDGGEEEEVIDEKTGSVFSSGEDDSVSTTSEEKEKPQNQLKKLPSGTTDKPLETPSEAVEEGIRKVELEDGEAIAPLKLAAMIRKAAKQGVSGTEKLLSHVQQVKDAISILRRLHASEERMDKVSDERGLRQLLRVHLKIGREGLQLIKRVQASPIHKIRGKVQLHELMKSLALTSKQTFRNLEAFSKRAVSLSHYTIKEKLVRDISMAVVAIRDLQRLVKSAGDNKDVQNRLRMKIDAAKTNLARLKQLSVLQAEEAAKDAN